MDEVDNASGAIEAHMAEALSRARQGAVLAPPRGACFFCEREVSRGKRFCDQDCRDDWQREEDAAHDPRNIRAPDA